MFLQPLSESFSRLSVKAEIVISVSSVIESSQYSSKATRLLMLQMSCMMAISDKLHKRKTLMLLA